MQHTIRKEILEELQVILKEEKQKNQQLNEGWFDDFMGSIGHTTLDVVAIGASLLPGVGSTVSIVADLGNALWYYSEGKTFTAALYTVMAIPGVGDVFALPIQLALKAGGKGLGKIPGIKKAFDYLVSNSTFLSQFFDKLLGYKVTAGLARSSKQAIEELVKIVQKEGTEGGIKQLEKKLAQEAQEKSLGKIVTRAVANQAVKATKTALKRVIPKYVGAVSDEEEVEAGALTGTEETARARGGKQCRDDMLKFGCRGENVRQMQQKLLDCNYKLPRKGADGWFGPETKRAVKAFQKDNNLKVDGIAGPITLSALEKCVSKKEEPSASITQPEPKPAEKVAIKDIEVGPIPGMPAYEKLGPDQEYLVTPSGFAVEIPPKIEDTPKDTSKDTPSMKRARGLPKKPRNDVYWQSNIWTQAPESEKTDALRDILVSKGFLKERTLQESYFMQSISNRHEEVSKVVFDKLLKEIKRG